MSIDLGQSLPCLAMPGLPDPDVFSYLQHGRWGRGYERGHPGRRLSGMRSQLPTQMMAFDAKDASEARPLHRGQRRRADVVRAAIVAERRAKQPS